MKRSVNGEGLNIIFEFSDCLMKFFVTILRMININSHVGF